MNTADRVRTVTSAYVDTIQVPPVEAIYARPDRVANPTSPTGSPRRRRRWLRAGVAVGAALAIGVPAAVAVITGSLPDPLAGLNPDAKTGAPASGLKEVPAGSQRVKGGYVTLTVLPGKAGDRSCFAAVFRDDQRRDISSESACGGGDKATFVENLLGAGVVYSDDPGVASVVVTRGIGVSEHITLHGRYGLTSIFSPAEVTLTTYDARGKVIATHHSQPPSGPPSSLK